jgi:hypothetical protein
VNGWKGNHGEPMAGRKGNCGAVLAAAKITDRQINCQLQLKLLIITF